MKPVMYGMKYIINHQIFKRKAPLICGLVLSNRCNLRCRHCRVINREKEDLSFAEIISALNSFYEQGGRNLYLEGGEPFMWRDNQYSIEDIVQYSHRLGFFSSIIYTNGTFPLRTSANTIFISMDGLKKTHDFLRGETFDHIMKNINQSNHPSLYLNYTINQYNKDEIPEFCEFINGIASIRGVFFYFHTPYYGFDDLYLDRNNRNEILLKLLSFKKRYKILNSQAGLRSALRNDWQRPLDVCRVYEKGKIFKCCRFPDDPELCQNCGYLSYAEIDQTLKLKPSAILNALKYY